MSKSGSLISLSNSDFSFLFLADESKSIRDGILIDLGFGFKRYRIITGNKIGKRYSPEAFSNILFS